MTCIENGQYLRLQVRIIGGTDGFYLGQASIYNVTHERKNPSLRRVDRLPRNILKLYNGLYYLNGRQDTFEVIKTLSPAVIEGQVYRGIDTLLQAYALHFVHDDDRERFLEFMNFRTLYKQAMQSKKADAGSIFRIKQADGSYRWTVFLAIILSDDQTYDILLCVRDDVWEAERNRKSLLPVLATSFGLAAMEPESRPYFRLMRELCQSMIHYADIKFFWKDRSRRFIGVSRAFLDYYGLKHEKDLIGKTDEDMGWHIDDHPYMEAEQAVLEKGEVVRNAVGQCIVHGRPHRIIATKFPVYRDKRIIGLLGYFFDSEMLEEQKNQLNQLKVIDSETGLLNFRGLLLAAQKYSENYHLYGNDYYCIILDVPEYDRIREDYGPEIAGKLLQKVTEQILSFHPLRETIAHLGSCRFLCIQNHGENKGIRSHLMALTHKVHGITEVGGYSCTLYLQYAVAQGSEGRDFDDILKLLTERLDDARQQQYGEALYIGDRLLFDKHKFDHLEEEVSIIDPDTYELVYINECLQKDFGLEDAYSWIGEKCYKVLAGSDVPCEGCINGKLRRDCFYTAIRHNRKNGRNLLMRATLIPWHGKDYRFTTAIDMNQYISRDLAENHVIFREAMANDVIAIGMREADPDKGLQKMLAHIGRSLQAERVLIFEESPDGTVSATYEWHQDDLHPVAGIAQHIPIQSLRPLYASFDAKQMTIIEDTKAFVRDNPGFQPHIPGIYRLVSGHLTQSGKSLGFTEVINPSALAFKSAGLLLSTLTIFLAIMMRNRDTLRSLEALSSTDPLTGVGNRRGFLEYLQSLPAGMSLSFVFGDLNGLKQTNDTRGHEAGDRLIRKAANIMKAFKWGHAVFRMGGDEFLLISENITQAQARILIRDLRSRYQSAGISMALGYIVRQTPILNIDEVLSEVDRQMYDDKERIYGHHLMNRQNMN